MLAGNKCTSKDARAGAEHFVASAESALKRVSVSTDMVALIESKSLEKSAHPPGEVLQRTGLRAMSVGCLVAFNEVALSSLCAGMRRSTAARKHWEHSGLHLCIVHACTASPQVWLSHVCTCTQAVFKKRALQFERCRWQPLQAACMGQWIGSAILALRVGCSAREAGLSSLYVQFGKRFWSQHCV